MTPYELALLIDCYAGKGLLSVMPTPLRDQTLRSFAMNGLIGNVDTYEITERGKAHVEYLLTRPWPVCKWVHES